MIGLSAVPRAAETAEPRRSSYLNKKNAYSLEARICQAHFFAAHNEGNKRKYDVYQKSCLAFHDITY